MSLNNKLKTLKLKITTAISALLILLGGYISQIQTCTQNAVVSVAQVSQNPANQIAVVEATSFVANLFYEKYNKWQF